jgi:hypothetical protein
MTSHESNERLLSVDLGNNPIINRETSTSTQSNEEITPADQKIIILGKQFDVTRKQFTVVSLLSIFYLLSNAYYSLLAPFFPSESLKKGISQTQVGMIFGVYELVVLVLSPIFGKYVCFF